MDGQPGPERARPTVDLFCILSQKSNLYGIIENWFANAGPRMQRRALCNNLNSIAMLTMRGPGLSTLPHGLYQAEIDQNHLCILRTDPPLPAVKYWAVYRSAEAESLAAVVAKMAAEWSIFTISD